MGITERKTLIKELENQLNARVLVLVTGDRKNMETMIAPDLLPLVAEHLATLGKADRIALFLYTPGGDSIAGWGLVNLIRQYCKEFLVLVPFRALSCGTLIALGADKIMMGRHGLLSPIDPSVASPFNPSMPGQQGPVTRLLPVSVEDMIGFLDLARKEIGVKSDESLIQVLKLLVDHVNPLALGAVFRAREQSAQLAARLLAQHIDDEAKVDRIVNSLTRELPTHGYLIGRKEAQNDQEFSIADISEDTESTLWSLYKEYASWLLLTQPASSDQDLGDEQEKVIHYERAAIESLVNDSLMQHLYVTDKKLMKVQTTPPGANVQIDQIMERLIYQGWLAKTDGEDA